MKAWILGVGMGPQHLTAEVAEALRSVDYVLAAEKSDDDALLALRHALVAAHAPDVPIIAIPDPPRDRSRELTSAGYRSAVSDWHAQRAARYAEVLSARGGTVAFLVWGDPSLYDSTIRIVETVAARMDLDYQVLPGISAPQLLAARHRIVLNQVGAAVHLTTGRGLAQAVAAGQDNIVAMLNADGLDLSMVADWQIWWGANLGAPSERLICGRVGEVAERIAEARQAARMQAGWVMDVLLVRRS